MTDKACENCRYATAIKYNAERLTKSIAELEERIQEKRQQIENETNHFILNSRYSALYTTIDTKRKLETMLVEMQEDIICQRYPQSIQRYSKYWCGEWSAEV